MDEGHSSTILRLALDANGIEPKDRIGKPVVFITMYGDAARINIQVFENGYSNHGSCDRLFDFYVDEPLNQSAYEEYYNYMYDLSKRYSNLPERKQNEWI